MAAKKTKLSYEKLRQMCVENNWFTAGTNEQYEKLFELNDTGTEPGALAVIIWICSEDVSLSQITGVLYWEAMKEENKGGPT